MGPPVKPEDDRGSLNKNCSPLDSNRRLFTGEDTAERGFTELLINMVK
jgi:hypothetical protein